MAKSIKFLWLVSEVLVCLFVSSADVVKVERSSEFGVETDYKQELTSLLEQIDIWGLDIFEVHKFSRQHSLTVITYTIFKKRNLMQKFNISPTKLVNYLLDIEANYQNVPYHNIIHAAEVTQSLHVLLLSPVLNNIFNDLEILAAFFAAAIHDVDHPGVSNQYLIDSANELAILYNDKSVLENHSLAVAFKLLQKGKDNNFLENLDKIQWKTLRKLSIDLVLATDMSQHFNLLSKLGTIIVRENASSRGKDKKILFLREYDERITVLQNVVHCADLSNPTKPLKIYRKWVIMLTEEFYRQGDKERTWRPTISPMCDRKNEGSNVENSQVQFIDYIVQPLWDTLANLLGHSPVMQQILENLADNRRWFAYGVFADSSISH